MTKTELRDVIELTMIDYDIEGEDFLEELVNKISKLDESFYDDEDDEE